MMFSGGIEMEHWADMKKKKTKTKNIGLTWVKLFLQIYTLIFQVSGQLGSGLVSYFLNIVEDLE